MMSKQHRLVVLLFILFMLLVACSSPEASFVAGDPAASESIPDQPTELKVCMSRGSMNAVHVYAQEQGLFQKYGLDVELITIDSGPTAVAALIAGDCDLGSVAGSPIANAVAAGHDLALVAGLFNKQLFSMVVTSHIVTGDDLRGKVVAVNRPGGSNDLTMRAMLRSFGLEPDVDVTILTLEGSQADRLAAMETGQVAAVLMFVPEALQATELGYRILVDPSDLDRPYPFTAIAVAHRELQDNRPALIAFLQAVIEANTLAKQDREGVTAVIASVMGLDQVADAAYLDNVYDHLILKYLESIPYIDRAGVQALLDEVALENEDAGSIDVDDMIDDSLIMELEDTGFIANLRGK